MPVVKQWTVMYHEFMHCSSSFNVSYCTVCVALLSLYAWPLLFSASNPLSIKRLALLDSFFITMSHCHWAFPTQFTLFHIRTIVLENTGKDREARNTSFENCLCAPAGPYSKAWEEDDRLWQRQTSFCFSTEREEEGWSQDRQGTVTVRENTVVYFVYVFLFM